MDPQITPQNIQPTPIVDSSPIQPEKPKMNTKIVIILLSIILVVLIASTGFLYYRQNLKLKNLAAFCQTQITPLPAASPSATLDPTADWKTFTNSFIGYSIKYPQNWLPSDIPTDSQKGYQIQIYFQTDPSKSVGSILIENMGSSVDGLASYDKEKIIGDFNAKCMTDSAYKTWCYLVSNKNEYVSFLIIKDQDDNYNKILDQILSTFKFTSQTVASVSTLETDKTACINQFGSSKYWDDTWKECQYSSNDPVWIQKMQNYCKAYQGNLNEQASTCRHVLPGEVCGPDLVMVCSFFIK